MRLIFIAVFSMPLHPLATLFLFSFFFLVKSVCASLCFSCVIAAHMSSIILCYDCCCLGLCEHLRRRLCCQNETTTKNNHVPGRAIVSVCVCIAVTFHFIETFHWYARDVRIKGQKIRICLATKHISCALFNYTLSIYRNPIQTQRE